jgi:hypothetical protein
MGSGRDKRKKAKGHTPGQGADKTAKKTEKNADKATRRLQKKAQVRCRLPFGKLTLPPSFSAPSLPHSLARPNPAICIHIDALQGGEDDIDAVLAQFKLRDEEATAVRVEEGCLPPSPRVYSSFVPMVSVLALVSGSRYFGVECVLKIPRLSS